MAQITGSSTTDWSGVSLPQGNFETDLVTYINRANQIDDAINNVIPAYSPISPTLFVVDLSIAERVTITGSGFDGLSPLIINSVSFRNTNTGEILRFTGTLDGIGNDVLTSATLGFPGFSETFKGTIIVPATFPDPPGNFSGTLTSLVVKIGGTTEILSGNFHTTGNNVSASLTGKVTGISVGSGADTIKMTGLSLSLDVLQAALGSPELDTVDDLFAFLSNHLPGNDTITYTNTSGAGMTFYGGVGHDTITINGPNADTLNGGAGNDTLNGGAGDDTLLGGDGNDVFLIGNTADHGGREVIDGGTGTDVIRFTSTSADQTLVLALGVTTVESVVIGTAVGVTTGITALNVDASAVGSGLSLTGNNGANTLTGTGFDDVLTGSAGNDILNGAAGNDTLIGGAGADNLQGGVGADLFLLASPAELPAGEIINGGDGTDTLRYTGNVAATLTLTNLVTNIEQVQIANAAGDASGTAAINLNAAAVGNGLTLTGNNGANVLTGTGQADRLTGNGGNDTLTGGAGDDTLLGGDGNDVFLFAVGDSGAGESVVGGAGVDALRFTATAGTLDLSGAVDVESVAIATAAGATTGTTAVNLNATNVTNALSIIGNNGANVLTGTDFDDVLIGNAGADTLIGGLDDDLFILDTATDTVVENLDEGSDTVRLAYNVAVPTLIDLNIAYGGNVENAQLTGTGVFNLTGNSANNTLTGNASKNTLIGGDGNDTLIGGAGADNQQGGIGNDLFLLGAVAEFAAGERIDGGADTDTLRYTGTVAATLSLSNLVTGVEQVQIASATGDASGTAAININAAAVGNGLIISGNAGNNVLTGTVFVDTLNGNGGNDTVTGGAGDDTLNGGDGNEVFLIAAGAHHGAGESIDGGAGVNVIRFTSGVTDTLTLSGLVSNIAEVEASDAAGGNAGTAALNINAAAVGSGLTLTGNAGANTLTGTAFADTLIGNLGNDTLTGGAGNDTLDGGLGADDMTGGADDDTYVIDNPLDVVHEQASGGTDTVRINRTVNLTDASFTEIENVVLTGTAAINATGNIEKNELTGNSAANILNGGAGTDQLTGNGGNDLLNGGAGDDAMDGGAGNDVILIGNAADHGVGEVINGGAGTDVIRFTSTTQGQSLILALGVTTVESVVIGTTAGITTDTTTLNVDASKVATALTIIGNSGANTLTGTSANDTMDGNAGNDTLRGGLGNDTVDGCTGNDTFLFGRGDGQDLFQDNGGTADKILYDAGINPLDLVISRQANNLRLAIHGFNEQITVQSWYVGTTNRIETIQAGGQTLLSTQVDQLIQAMAGFTATTSLSWDAAIDGGGTPQQQTQFQGIIAASWH